MKSICRQALMVLALLFCVNTHAAPYPDEEQLRTSIGAAAKILAGENLPMKILDARTTGVKLTLTAAGMDLTDGVCLVFINPTPEEALKRFFDGIPERDMPIWLDAIAVHEVTHCIEQREAYVRQQFGKVLPPKLMNPAMNMKGYVGIVKSGAVDIWAEALADIAAVLYLQQTAPAQWMEVAKGIMAMRHELAGKWPTHDTSPWLRKLIAQEPAPRRNIFETAFELRRQLSPQ